MHAFAAGFCKKPSGRLSEGVSGWQVISPCIGLRKVTRLPSSPERHSIGAMKAHRAKITRGKGSSTGRGGLCGQRLTMSSDPFF